MLNDLKYEITSKPYDFKCKYITKIRKGKKMALIYEITVGPPVDGDTTERKLTVEVNNKVIHEQKYFYATENFGEFSFSDDDSVVISLVDIDDKGNESEPAMVAFVARDTIPPQQPNALGVKILREENDVKPTPTPETEETTTPKPIEPVLPSGSYGRFH